MEIATRDVSLLNGAGGYLYCLLCLHKEINELDLWQKTDQEYTNVMDNFKVIDKEFEL